MRALLTIALCILLPACGADGSATISSPHRSARDSGGELEGDDGIFEGDDDADPAADPPPEEDPTVDPPSDPEPEPDPGAPPPPTCADNKKLCGDQCVNVLRDRDNCGGCGRACSSNATGCYDGKCTCGAGHHLCGLSCVNLQSNENNCGACGHACGSAKKCCNGACKSSC